jgi:hypothetical protein
VQHVSSDFDFQCKKLGSRFVAEVVDGSLVGNLPLLVVRVDTLGLYLRALQSHPEKVELT